MPPEYLAARRKSASAERRTSTPNLTSRALVVRVKRCDVLLAWTRRPISHSWILFPQYPLPHRLLPREDFSPNFAREWGSYLCLKNCPWIPGFLVAVAARVPKPGCLSYIMLSMLCFLCCAIHTMLSMLCCLSCAIYAIHAVVSSPYCLCCVSFLCDRCFAIFPTLSLLWYLCYAVFAIFALLWSSLFLLCYLCSAICAIFAMLSLLCCLCYVVFAMRSSL